MIYMIYMIIKRRFYVNFMIARSSMLQTCTNCQLSRFRVAFWRCQVGDIGQSQGLSAIRCSAARSLFSGEPTKPGYFQHKNRNLVNLYNFAHCCNPTSSTTYYPCNATPKNEYLARMKTSTLLHSRENLHSTPLILRKNAEKQ
jgi:hypothetical protein